MSAVESFTSLLKTSRQSLTKPRLAVFNALLGQEPMNMHELVGKVRGVDRASVYRTVELFERLGIVQRLNIGWKYKLELSDKFAEHHHHLTCLRCGRTIDMGEGELENAIEQLARKHNFRPATHQIEIQGYCDICSKPLVPVRS